jgi:hypothetical protein
LNEALKKLNGQLFDCHIQRAESPISHRNAAALTVFDSTVEKFPGSFTEWVAKFVVAHKSDLLTEQQTVIS